MGKLKNGIFGGLTGKVGNVVGSSCRGVEYIKSRPAKMTNPRSKGQTKQRGAFKLTQNFLRTITPLIRIGFKDQAVDGQSAFNAAMSYNILNGIKVNGEGVELDFPNILVSKGSLNPAKGINVDITEEGVQFTWNPVPKDNAGNDDQVMVIVYNSDKEIAVHDINAGKRSSSATKIKFPDDWNGDSIETYIAFKKADGSVVSDSIYCGCFKI